MFTLHKLPEGFIITSDEDIKDHDLVLDNNKVTKCERGFGRIGFKKVIAQQDQIDFSALSEEEQKEIGWFDVEELAYEFEKTWGSTYNGEIDFYIEGFQKAQELLSDRNNLKDIIQQFKNLIEELPIDWMGTGDSKSARRWEKDWNIQFNKFIESLSQPKSWKIECVEENGKIKILKLL